MVVLFFAALCAGHAQEFSADGGYVEGVAVAGEGGPCLWRLPVCGDPIATDSESPQIGAERKKGAGEAWAQTKGAQGTEGT